MFNHTCPIPIELPQDPVPFLSNGNINFKAHDIGWLISGFFALIGIVASFWLIDKHLTNFYSPSQQRHLVRILFMVPIYATTSFLSYYFYNEALYFQLIRDCYEAFVISSFFHLLLSYLSSPLPTPANPCPAPYESKSERLAALKEVFREVKVGKWMFPLGWVKARPAGGGKGEGEAFLWYMRIGIGQYVIIRPLSTLISVVSQSFHQYCSVSWSPYFFHVYMTVLVSISVSIAMYCVLQLYMPLSNRLKPYRPVLKFLSVKSVVFLTFWQETMLGLLEFAGVIKRREYWSAAEIVIGLSAILSCFEMMIFGFVHIKAFTYLPYRALAPEVPAKLVVSRPSSPASFPPQSFEEWKRLESQHSTTIEQNSKLVPLKEGDLGRRGDDGKPALRRTKRLYSLVRVLDISDIFAELRHEAGYVVKKKEDFVNREDDLEVITGRRRENKFTKRDDDGLEKQNEVEEVEEVVKNKWSKEGAYRENESLLQSELPYFDNAHSPQISSSKKRWWKFSNQKSPPPQTFEQVARVGTNSYDLSVYQRQPQAYSNPPPTRKSNSSYPPSTPHSPRPPLSHEPISTPSFDIPSYTDPIPPPHKISRPSSTLPPKRSSKTSNRLSNSHLEPLSSNLYPHVRQVRGAQVLNNTMSRMSTLPPGARASLYGGRDSREVKRGEVNFVFEEY